MKKKYKMCRTIIVLFIFLVGKLGAQLSGIVTINNTLPSSATNFTSFTTFASVVNTAGVNGPLTVNVTGTSTAYNEQVNFNQAPGISATNTITINGNGAILNFNTSSTTLRYTLLLSGADYMTFNNLNVIGGGSASAFACHLWNASDNNSFNSCTFSVSISATGTGVCPFSVSGSSVTVASAGNSGNNNVVNSCTITGGYYSTVFYGSSSTPFNTGNQVLNSVVRDFYAYGMYNVYCNSTTFKGNVVERVNRIGVTTTYAIYFSTGSIANEICEGNHIRNLFITSASNIAYCIYITTDATFGSENIIRNNIVSDIRTTGTIYGIILSGSAYVNAYHNTIAIDDPLSTGGIVYGIYTTGPNDKVRNNIVYINKGGASAKYCLYTSTAATSLLCNNNVYYNISALGDNIGYRGTAYTLLSSWQSNTGLDLNSIVADPIFTNPAALNYVPTSTVINNMCPPVGVLSDFNLTARSLLFPDPGAYEMYTTNCSGIPAANSFTIPGIPYCPGATLELNLLNSGAYTNSGYMISWQTSTNSSVGPFTVVPTATLNSYMVPPLTLDVYYRAVVTCTSGGSYTTASQFIDVAVTTTNTVPYYESFESLAQNELPNCSWSASNIGNTTLTYSVIGSNYRAPHTGSNFASFYNSPGGSNYFYTNGIFLKAGVTYSAGVWFIAETTGYNNWDLSILVGPNQSPSGMTTVAASNGTLTPQLYTLLSDTFLVSVSGLYYFAVKATSAANVAPYLSWDDLSITIPCELNGPDLGLSSSTNTVCAGQTANLTGIGADNYSWSTGQTTPVILVTPMYPTTYTLTGIYTLSGCTKTLTQFIDVKASPPVIAYMQGTIGCAGQNVSLTAVGADTYFWNNGASTASTTVAPMVNTSFSVAGTNSLGCTSIAVVHVSVNSLPAVTVPVPALFVCKNDEVTVMGSGAINYRWLLSPTITHIGNPLITMPSSSAIYTVVGTDIKGCEGRTYLSVGVDECTGLSEQPDKEAIRLYPNPGSGIFVVELSEINQKIEIIDPTGRVILSEVNLNKTYLFNISSFSDGVYYIKVTGTQAREVLKVVKQAN